MPERFPADQPFSTESYLHSMAQIRGAGRDSAERWIDRLGLGPFRTVRLPELSKGTAQKVGLAQALLQPPDLLVLDEPWEGLDGATRDLVPDIVAEVTEQGGSVLVSDHRGETAWLAQASYWTVDAGTVVAGNGGQDHCVIEVSVPAAEATGVVARLRADGMQILRVRNR